MSDQSDSNNANNSIDDCHAISCYLPKKRIKLSTGKNRTVRSLTDKIQIQTNSNSWKFIKNEAMIAELSGGKLTLWQFLLELLMSDEYSGLIKWTDRNIGEFILIQAEEVAKLWGIRKDRNHRMNYDKLSRALRYYYQKNIIKKVHGHKFVYQFVSLVPDIISGSGSFHKAISPGDADVSSHGHPLMSSSDTETVSTDNCCSRINGIRAQPQTTSSLRSPTKNNSKGDFNGTMAALFQAALISLSGSNSEALPSSYYSNQNDSDSRVGSPSNSHGIDSSLPGPRTFDMPTQTTSAVSQDGICKPEMTVIPTSAGMLFPGTSGVGSTPHLPPFDRQSMLHFSRHSINMQRLSQEILLQATSKCRFNAGGLGNPLLSPVVDPVGNSMDQANSNLWLNHLARDLYKSAANISNPNASVDKQRPPVPTSPEGYESPKARVKTETSLESAPSLESRDHDNLATLFQKFVTKIDSKSNTSTVSTTSEPSRQAHNYSHADLANLIRSQMSSHSSFVWMPVPVHFAEEIMEFCTRSSSNQST